MKFDLSEDQALLRNSTRDFLGGEWPIEKVRKVVEEPRGYGEDEWLRLAEMGYLGLTVDAAKGGQGLGAIEFAIVLEEIGRACMPGPYLDVALAADLLARAAGSHELLAEVFAGKKIATLARLDAPFAGSSEPAAHANASSVCGTKYFVPFASEADALLVQVPEGVYLVSGPFAVEPMPTLDLAQRFGEVRFDHAAAWVGDPSLLERTDRLAAVGAAAMLLGIMGRCLEMTLQYVQTRQAFRRPIGSFQALQHRLADMLLRTESTRSMVYRAAWCFDAGDADTALACAAAKAYASDAARLVCGESIQMHGGIGFTWELDLHLYFKRAKTLEQHYGSTEMQIERALEAVGY